MEIDMKEILMIIKLLDKEHMFFKKVINIMENGLMEKKMAMELVLNKQVRNMKGIGQMICIMVKGHYFWHKVLVMLEYGIKIKNKEKENIFGLMEIFMKETGIKA